MVARRELGTVAHHDARALAEAARQRPASQRGHARFVVRKDDRERRWGAGLRRRKEDTGQEAPPASRYRRFCAKGQSASPKIPDQDGLRLLLEPAKTRGPRLSHLWLDAGYRGRGKEWAEEALGLSVELVHRTLKPASDKVLLTLGSSLNRGNLL